MIHLGHGSLITLYSLTPKQVAEELRASVYDETGLTCSAGVAPNRLLAKVCSDINKPNGQFVLPNDRIAVMTYISSLPIRKLVRISTGLQLGCSIVKPGAGLLEELSLSCR